MKTYENFINGQWQAARSGQFREIRDPANGELVAKPVRRPGARRYTLKELMRGATPKLLRSLERDTAWFREGKALGRELA